LVLLSEWMGRSGPVFLVRRVLQHTTEARHVRRVHRLPVVSDPCHLRVMCPQSATTYRIESYWRTAGQYCQPDTPPKSRLVQQPFDWNAPRVVVLVESDDVLGGKTLDCCYSGESVSWCLSGVGHWCFEATRSQGPYLQRLQT
jgi:hypothetical protein